MTIRILVLAATIALGLAGLATPAHGQDTPDPTVSALQTRVAELEATVAAHAASPVATPRPVATSLDLLNALLATPLDLALLPVDVGPANATQWEYGDDDLAGAIGGVIIEFAETDTYGINYIVYPGDMEADAAFALLAADSGTPVAIEGTPAATGETRVIFTFSDYVVCTHLSGETVVIGGVLIDDNIRIADAPALACAMTDAGLTHLRSLRGH